MHMPAAAAAWAEWAVWTCNTPHRVTVEKSGLLARFFFRMACWKRGLMFVRWLFGAGCIKIESMGIERVMDSRALLCEGKSAVVRG